LRESRGWPAGGLVRRPSADREPKNAVNTIDYIYRFDPKNPSLKPAPPDTEAARELLESGNRMFANWMESCRTSNISTGAQYVVQCNGLEVGMNRAQGQLPKQAPFAVVVGCSDARVPIEMLFGQGFNDLFVIRVAGNVLGDVCMGSIEFAMNALSESVKCVVVLGHLGCGAVSGAVDAYLRPLKFWSKSSPPMLRTITQRIFVAVREADNGLRESWGDNRREVPGYRDALVDIAVCVNAAQAAFDLRQEVERAAKWEIEVLYGVFGLRNHQVSMPVDPHAPIAPENVNLAYAPTNPKEFGTIAVRMADLLKTTYCHCPQSDSRLPGVDGSPSGANVAARAEGLPPRRDDHLGIERSD
jgi:carbonic anhydrase